MTHQTLIYGPAYRDDEAPFPEALEAEPLPPFPAPRVTPRGYRTTTARRRRLTILGHVAALIVTLL